MAIMDGYIRVSKVGGREGEAYRSPKLQRASIEQWARAHEIDLGRFVQDEDVSGKKAARDRGLEALLQRIDEGASTGIIVYKMDRFGREAADVTANVKRAEAVGARIVSTTEGIDSSTRQGKLMTTLLAGLGEDQWIGLRDGFDRATGAAVESGIHIACRPPVGYERNGKRRLIPSKDAPAIRKAFKLRANGASHGAIRDFLIEVLGRGISKSSVTGMLENPVYLGQARGPYEHKKEGAHEPLVDPDTWHRVAARKGVRVKNASLAEQAMLGGLVRCASCGHKLRIMGSTNRQGVREASYVCAAKYAGGNCESPAAARVKLVDQYVIELVADAWDEIKATGQNIEQRYLEAKTSVDLANRGLDEWLQDIDQRLVIGKERYDATTAALQRKLEEARRVMYELEDVLPKDATIITLGGQPMIYELWGDNPERDRQTLRGIVQEVRITRSNRGRWQPIEERVEVRWVGQAA